MITRILQDIRDAEQAFDAAPSWQAWNRAYQLDAELRAVYADIRPRFVCEWEQENSPTRGMTEANARAYYKANSVKGDCRFAMRFEPGTDRYSDMPINIFEAWLLLLADCEAAGKETAEHRSRRDAIRTATRRYLAGQSFTLPASVVPKPRASRKPSRMTACPHCGGQVAVA